MKVFNEEISRCWKCSFFNHPVVNTTATPYCNYKGFIILEPNLIHKDCPFNQEITKEVIEGFGFEYIGELPDAKYIGNYKKGIYKLFTIGEMPRYITISTYLGDSEKMLNCYLFNGIINNPEEFKFIITCLGII